MVQNIFVGVMCVIVAAVAVWGWWLENGPEKKDKEDEKKEKDAKEEESTENPQKSKKEKK